MARMKLMREPNAPLVNQRLTIGVSRYLMGLRGIIRQLSVSLVIVAVGCLGDSVPDGRILVKNDSQDREFNVISVFGNGKYAVLKPGERVLLPPGTRSITATRRYATYTRRYSVACPTIEGSGIVIKMIDMHTNRMPAGCKTISASKD